MVIVLSYRYNRTNEEYPAPSSHSSASIILLHLENHLSNLVLLLSPLRLSQCDADTQIARLSNLNVPSDRAPMQACQGRLCTIILYVSYCIMTLRMQYHGFLTSGLMPHSTLACELEPCIQSSRHGVYSLLPSLAGTPPEALAVNMVRATKQKYLEYTSHQDTVFAREHLISMSS